MSDKKSDKLSDKKSDEKIILSNVNFVLINALSVSVALGFNDLVTTIFNSFPGSNHIMKKSIYVVIMFIITLSLAFWFFKLKQNIKSKD
jgi:hypothetical protein